jgi:hypothetical protein
MAKNGLLTAVRRICGALALCALAGSFVAVSDAAGAAEGRKLALVIGNDAYENQPALAKAVGDAHAMQATLERLGFEVRLAENLSYAGMVGTLANFQSSIEPGDTVAIHFSGHGVAANGRNYLLPVDFPQPESGRQGEVLLPRLAFDAGEIVDGLRAQGAKLTLAVFDACRDNALTSGTRSIGMSRGLVRMDPPRGVFVMFSAGPGELAADRLTDEDPEATSVFTRVFIPILETPGLTLVEIAKRTQVKVSELAATVDHQQFPDYSDRVIGDVVLLPKPESESPATGTETEVAAVAPTTTPPPATPPLSGKVVPPAPAPADADVALCDSVAGDPYDPSLPASVDRVKLYDLERIVDEAAARYALSSTPSYDPANPLVLPEMPGAMVVCDLAMKENPGERRFAYQRTRAICLSGRSDLCPDELRRLESLGHPSAAKFAAFVRLSGIDDGNATGGLAELVQPLLIDDWFGLPGGTPEEVPTARNLLSAADAKGDVEATALMLLLDNKDNQDVLLSLLTESGRQGIPTALAAGAVAVSGPTDISEPMRTVLQEAADKGSHLARIVLALSYRTTSTPGDLQKAKDVLAPAVAAGSPTAALILKQIEDEANRANAAPAETPAEPEATSGINFGDDTYSYANDGVCDDRRFVGPGMTDTSTAGANVGHDATDCRTAFEAGRLTLRFSPTSSGVAAAVGIDFGDDASSYAKDGLCDDSRFTGSGMTDLALIDADIRHDATDCQAAFEAGALTLAAADSAAANASPGADVGDDKYKALAGRDVFLMVNPSGKATAALVEERLRAAGMNVMFNEVEEEDNQFDHDLDYEAKDSEVASLVQELLADIYPMNLAISTSRSIPNVTITPNLNAAAPQQTSSPAAVDPGDDKYKALAGREIWIMVSPNGKAKAALVEERLKAAGMSVLINEVENNYNQWDGDLDYEAKDSEVVSLVKELISDLYVMDLAIADTRSIPNITITPSE